MALSQEYEENWSVWKKALFKFIFSYFSLYIILRFSSRFFEIPFKWIGKNILGISYAYNANGFGSGDHTFAYVTLFINVLLCFLISFLWILLDRKKESYNQLFYWFIVCLRIFLVYHMLYYGFFKIIQLQFSYPSLTKMMEPLGNSSPMGLAWTYLGYSKSYNLFMGLMEITGGLLLIPRRTSTLGAFVTMSVMMHVVVMNFTYDIPVKLFSSHLFLMALFIFSTDSKRFINLFIKNKTASSYKFYNPIKNKVYHKVIFWVKSVLVLLFVGLFFINAAGNSRGKNTNNIPTLYGVWEVEEFIKDGDTLLPLLTENKRWHYLIVENKNSAVIKTMNDLTLSYKFETDTIGKKLKIYSEVTNSKAKYNFKYQESEEKKLVLEGKLSSNHLIIKLKRKDLLLDSREFHWINETPFNR